MGTATVGLVRTKWRSALGMFLPVRPQGQSFQDGKQPMSIRVMTAVFDHSQARLADRLVLLVIADRSDDDGTGCYRGKESIAKMAGVSRSQVTVSIQRLKALGELRTIDRPGRSNEYEIVLPLPGQILAPPPGEDLADTRLPVEPTPGQTGSRDPSSYSPSDSSAIASQEEPNPWRPTEDELKAGRDRAEDALRLARANIGRPTKEPVP